MEKINLIFILILAFNVLHSVWSEENDQKYDAEFVDDSEYNEARMKICKQNDMNCTRNNQCCSGKCNLEMKECVCQSRRKPCCFDEQCCSKSCTRKHGHKEKTCRCSPLGQNCTVDRDCCFRDKSRCVDGKCKHTCICSELGAGCSKNSDCCPNPNAECIDSICTACSPSGSNCTSSTECCPELSCSAGKCGPVPNCTVLGAGCLNNTDCCSDTYAECINSICTACLQSGSDCTSAACCPELDCSEETFICVPKCKELGSPCQSTSECCPNSFTRYCFDNVCMTGCALIGESCIDLDLPCCSNSTCLAECGCSPMGIFCLIDTDCCNNDCDIVEFRCRT